MNTAQLDEASVGSPVINNIQEPLTRDDNHDIPEQAMEFISQDIKRKRSISTIAIAHKLNVNVATLVLLLQSIQCIILDKNLIQRINNLTKRLERNNTSSAPTEESSTADEE